MSVYIRVVTKNGKKSSIAVNSNIYDYEIRFHRGRGGPGKWYLWELLWKLFVECLEYKAEFVEDMLRILVSLPYYEFITTLGEIVAYLEIFLMTFPFNIFYEIYLYEFGGVCGGCAKIRGPDGKTSTYNAILLIPLIFGWLFVKRLRVRRKW